MLLNRALVCMTKGRVKEFLREPSAFFFAILMPMVWMSIFGLMFSKEGRDPICFGIPSELLLTEDMSAALKNETGLKVFRDSEEALEKKLRRREIPLILSYNQNWIMRGNNSTADYALAKETVSNFLQKTFGRKDVIQITEKQDSDVQGRYIDFLIPGLIALGLLTTSLFGTGMGIVTSRRENLLKRYKVTPMKLRDYILSHIFGRYLIACLEIGCILLFGWAVFGYQIKGSFFDFLITLFLGTGAFTALGILAGSRAQNSSAYHGLVHLVTMPLMMVSGVWFSVDGFPSWLKVFIQYTPLAALVECLRGVSMDGVSLMDYSTQVASLGGFGFACAVLAVRFFRF